VGDERFPRIPGDWAVQALRSPASLAALDLPQWELLIRQARRADVLARVAEDLATIGQLESVPPSPLGHLRAARRFAAAQQEDVRRELRHVGAALAPIGAPVLLLKGAAYVHLNSPAAAGRLLNDVDILVPRSALEAAESQLMVHGWLTTHLTPYDQRYYREWMHELPPMQHVRRHSTLDVHHAILPTTARLKPATALLLADALPAGDGFQVLSPVDRVLHSICHLLHNEELSHGLRDLSDIDRLLRCHAGERADFWPALIARARALDLARPLHYGLRCARRLLGTPVPAEALAEAAAAAPGVVLGPLMDALWRRALGSQHPTAALPFTPAALFLLYVRAHWLRMPPLLLARHLATKAWMRSRPQAEATV